MFKSALLITLVILCFPSNTWSANPDDNTLHIYSSRHYKTDEALYNDFTAQTGITIKRVDGKGDALIARLQQEGRLTPADLLITVDSGRLWRAENANLFQPIESEVLKSKIPSHLRHEDNKWFGFSTRARVLVYNKKTVKEGTLSSYQDIANPKYKGRVCVRSSGNIYNLSLLSSMIVQDGEEKAKTWAQNVLNNLARKPQGGDTDQIKAVAAGICDIALVNSYYLFRLQRSEEQTDQDIIKNVSFIYPNQDTSGTHVNISGAGILKHAKNKAGAIKFLEYLTTDKAQRYFADGNNEYPVVESVTVNDIVETQKSFKSQEINVGEFGKQQNKARMIFDTIAFP